MNKTVFAQNSILVIISVLCMHYDTLKDGFTLWASLNLQTFEA